MYISSLCLKLHCLKMLESTVKGAHNSCLVLRKSELAYMQHVPLPLFAKTSILLRGSSSCHIPFLHEAFRLTVPHFATPFVCCHLFMESSSLVMFAYFTHFAAAAHISCATYCNAQQWPRILLLKHAATFVLDTVGSWRVSAVYKCLSQIGLPEHRLHIR